MFYIGKCIRNYKNHFTYIYMSCVLLSFFSERLVKLYDYYEGTFQDFLGHDDSVNLVRFSKDGTYLYSTAHKELLVWTVNL